MKKVLCLLLIFTFILPIAVKSNSTDQIVLYIGSNKAIVNDEVNEIDENSLIVPILENSSTFVPVRFIAEKLNMKVSYEDKTETVTLNGNDMCVSFRVNSNKININGIEKLINEKNANTVTIINNDRTFLPIRALSEAVGKQVFYDRGLIIISDDALAFDAEKDKTILDEMIKRLNTLMVVGDRETLQSLVKNNIPRIYYAAKGDVATGGVMAPTQNAIVQESVAIDSSKANNTDDYSKTNTQVEGVDEADIVKTDGNYIYQISESKILITRINPVEQMSITSIIKDDTRSFNPIEVYVDGDKLTIISNVSNNQPTIYDSAVTTSKMIAPPYIRNMQYTQCAVYNISDRAKPELERVFEIEGNYISSRKIGDIVYMVTNKYFYMVPGENDPVAPMLKDTKQSDYSEIPLTDVYYFPKFSENNYITIASIDTTKPDQKAGVNTFLGAGQNIYVSKENMYIAAATYTTESSTVIYKFSLNNGEITFLTKASVPGNIINQFSMDEYEGNFRIATTSYTDNQQTNNLYILDSAMQKRGSITGIAPGENIYSTRFVGNRGYMVTFKLVDPLFVLDLSDIDNPKILGKLKIPGYSNYLHPVDENHIIGFGKDSQEYNGGAFYQGMKMALFDITDVENPVEKYVEKIGDRGTDSPLLYNHKALLYDKDKNLLAFPVTVNTINTANKENSITQYGSFEFNGAYVYDFSVENGFALKGKISHLTKDDYLKLGEYFDYKKAIERILYANGNLFTVSKSNVQAHSVDKIELKNSIDIK